MAVAIACGTLAFTHINSASPFWVESIAYPGITLFCVLIIATTLIQRFRRRIKATHDERWAQRQIGSRTDEQNMTSIEAVLFDFDGTLAPNLDLLDMRRQVANLTVKAGVPEEIFRIYTLSKS